MSQLNFAENLVYKGMKSFTKPKHKFDKSKAPAAPDYTKAEWWAATPSAPAKSEYVPGGCLPTEINDREFDVFYIHPTSNFSTNYWNAPLDLAKATELVDEINMTGQASVFNEVCKIYAPRYRQATFYSFLEFGADSTAALDLAYEDIRVAFRYFLEHQNEGRPFFIAGHSQGCVHGIRLLEDEIDNAECRERLVAAYLLGFQLPDEKFGASICNVKKCTGRFDVGCIISWDTYGDSGGPIAELDNCGHYDRSKNCWERRANKPVFSVNPLTWTSDKALVPKEYHRGGCRTKLKMENFSWRTLYADEAMGIEAKGLSRPYEGEVSAQLDEQGILKISKPKHKAFTMGVMPNENYHIFDFALFYMDIRDNVAERAASYKLSKPQ